VLGVAVAPSETELKVSNIRIPELDGFRGLMTLFVVYSHFFVEVPHGIGIFYFGWVAVIAFFVLSGYLVGRLIMEKKECRNFLPVFYLRRICRTFPTYFLASALLLLIADAIADRVWADGLSALPAWSYFVFAQNFFMLTRESVGLHWLAPSWTLALEEQFYIFAPLLFLLLPRRWWIAALSALCVFGLDMQLASRKWPMGSDLRRYFSFYYLAHDFGAISSRNSPNSVPIYLPPIDRPAPTGETNPIGFGASLSSTRTAAAKNAVKFWVWFEAASNGLRRPGQSLYHHRWILGSTRSRRRPGLEIRHRLLTARRGQLWSRALHFISVLNGNTINTWPLFWQNEAKIFSDFNCRLIGRCRWRPRGQAA
jgi:peptidoglycan/LPS O-acetylase OafA/YrhL